MNPIKSQQNPPITPIWFQLIHANGKPYQGSECDYVSQQSLALPNVADFRNTVHAKFANNKLKDTVAIDLKIFENEEAFNAQRALRPQGSIAGLGDDEAPLLVLVPNPQIIAMSTWDAIQDLPELDYNPNNHLFELDIPYLTGSGLPHQRKLLLYCRSLFHEQFRFLRDRVIGNRRKGWILGPPGTGKSTTALAFLYTLRAEWTVTWIGLSRTNLPLIIRYENGKKKTREHKNIYDIVYMLDCEVDEGRKHLVLLDGFVSVIEGHTHLQQIIYSWSEKKENRHLAVICSMSSRGKTNLERDIMNCVEEFSVYSWTFHEFMDASNHQLFFDSVKHNFDACKFTSQRASHKDMIRSKFYYAGGSSRFMFSVNTTAVVDCIRDSVSAVADILPYIDGTGGERADSVINRLFSLYLIQDEQKTNIISQFASVLLAQKHGPAMIHHLAQVIKNNENPSMDGWMLEMWFFACLRRTGIQLYNNHDDLQEEWPQSSVKILNHLQALSLKEATWFKPKKWNQGGYDAIFIDTRLKLVRFVQVTRGDSHSFKIEYFSDFLFMLQTSECCFEIETLDIVFIVQQEKLQKFKISTVTGEGTLSAFPGWKKGHEKDKVRILGIKDWNYSSNST